MISIIQDILSRLLLAFVPSIIWTFLSLLITYGLYHIKGKELPGAYSSMLSYMFLTNYILIFLVLIFFTKDNIPFI